MLLERSKNMYKTIYEVRRRIDDNYNAIKQFEKLLYEETDNDSKINIIHVLGLLYSELVTGQYSSDYLENVLSDIAGTIEFKAADKKYTNHNLIVMTGAAKGGGHTVIANNWIRWDKENIYSIVFSDMEPANVPDFLEIAVKSSGGKIYFLRGSDYEKAKQLLEIAKPFSKVIMLQHMYDIVPNLAFANPNWDTPIFMYNHANFKFSFGYRVSDKLLSLLDYDTQKAVKYRGIKKENALFLQFPNAGNIVGKNTVELSSENITELVIKKYHIDLSKKLVVSMGDNFKYKDIIGCSFVKYVTDLINMRNGDTQYLVIGADPNEAKWEMMQKNTDGLARATGYIPRDEAYELIRLSNLYISSFPMGATGISIADIYEVPYLFFTLTGRGVESYKSNYVDSIEDLINKCNDVLDGNKDKYIGNYYKKVLNSSAWCDEWHKIENSVERHQLQPITPHRYIEDEEIINCQLMQDKACQYLKNMLKKCTFDKRSISALITVCDEYDLDIIPDNFSLIKYDELVNARLTAKKNKYLLDYTNKMLKQTLSGLSISNYLIKEGITLISIYGMGQMGINLYNMLKNSEVKVECFIDKNAQKLSSAPIKIIDLTQPPQISRVIINSAVVKEETIRTEYKCITREYAIISLFDILDNMEEQ